MDDVKATIHQNRFYRPAILGALLLSTYPLQANPFAVGPGPIIEPRTLSAIIAALLVEAFCVVLLLRRSRTPRFFVLWIMGMHAVTYPVFLGVLWLAVRLPPVASIALGEALIVLIESVLIYLMCSWAPSRKAAMPVPSVGKALLVSLAGNISSMVAFPIISLVTLSIARWWANRGMD